MTPPTASTQRLPVLLLSALLTACGGGGATASPTPTPAPTPPSWRLVWSDEFDGAAGSAPNPAYWNYDIGNAETQGWGNHELQYYTDSRRNSFLDGEGHLVLRAERDANAGPCWHGKACEFSSGRLRSDGKVGFSYGKIEARIQLSLIHI